MTEILLTVVAAFVAYVFGKLQAEHQVRFTRIYEERANVVSDLYKLVVETETSLKQYAYPFGRGSEEHKQSAASDFRNLWNYYHTKSIWLDQSVSDTMEAFLKRF